MIKSNYNKEPEVCIPKMNFGVLTFETRFFEIGGDICEIIGTTANPHSIDFKYKGEIYNRTVNQIKNTLNI